MLHDHLNLGAVRVNILYPEFLDEFGQYRNHDDGPVILIGPSTTNHGGVTYTTTLFHEMLHCISDLYDLDLTEGQVRCLEQQIAAMFSQNPEWLQSYVESLT